MRRSRVAAGVLATLVLLVFGLVLLGLGLGGSVVAAILGGILAGVGAVVLVVVFSVLPLGSLTPTVVGIGGAVVGLLVVIVCGRRRRPPPAETAS